MQTIKQRRKNIRIDINIHADPKCTFTGSRQKTLGALTNLQEERGEEAQAVVVVGAIATEPPLRVAHNFPSLEYPRNTILLH